MKSNIARISCAIVAAGLLATTPAILSQMRGGGTMGPPPQQSQPGMQPNNMQQPNGPMAMQNNPEAMFIGHIRRNSKVETDLSKLAVKNSSNDGVKTFASQVISENRKNEMEMTSTTASNPNLSNMSLAADTPSQTRKAEKQMKKLSGTPFDAMYISQMEGYIKDDQKTIGDASDTMNSSDMGSMLMQMRNTTDNRSKQLAQLAQSENIKIQ